MKKQDRNWVKPPNTISKQTKQTTRKTKSKEKQQKYPEKISYWIDKSGEAQLYTTEQLAICNVLMNLNVLLNKSLTLAEKIQTMEKDVPVAILAQQDYAQFKKFESSVYGHFVELMAAAPDVTFGEFLNFISQGDETKELTSLGKRKLKKIIENKSPDVTSFYSSDKLLDN